MAGTMNDAAKATTVRADAGSKAPRCQPGLAERDARGRRGRQRGEQPWARPSRRRCPRPGSRTA